MEKKICDLLNRSLERAVRELKYRKMDEHSFLPNVMFFCGDSLESANDIVEKWAKDNNVNLFVVDGNDYDVIRCASEMVSIGYLTKSYLAPTKEQIEKLNKDNTVLFLKNIHKMDNKFYRRKIFDFINELIVADESKEEGYTVVNNMLFAVATVGEMDHSEAFEMCTIEAKDAFICRIHLDK